MADLTDDEFASVVASIGGLPSNLTSETGRMIAELQRYRAAQAADKERIKSVVRESIRRAATCLRQKVGSQIVNNAAKHAAEQLATAATILSDDDIDQLESVLKLIDLATRETDIEWVPDVERALINRLITGARR